jgi:hypothetical protein
MPSLRKSATLAQTEDRRLRLHHACITDIASVEVVIEFGSEESLRISTCSALMVRYEHVCNMYLHIHWQFALVYTKTY